MPAIPDIPDEILEERFEHAQGEPTVLTSAALASRQWRESPLNVSSSTTR